MKSLIWGVLVIAACTGIDADAPHDPNSAADDAAASLLALRVVVPRDFDLMDGDRRLAAAGQVRVVVHGRDRDAREIVPRDVSMRAANAAGWVTLGALPPSSDAGYRITARSQIFETVERRQVLGADDRASVEVPLTRCSGSLSGRIHGIAGLPPDTVTVQAFWRDPEDSPTACATEGRALGPAQPILHGGTWSLDLAQPIHPTVCVVAQAPGHETKTFLTALHFCETPAAQIDAPVTLERATPRLTIHGFADARDDELSEAGNERVDTRLVLLRLDLSDPTLTDFRPEAPGAEIAISESNTASPSRRWSRLDPVQPTLGTLGAAACTATDPPSAAVERRIADGVLGLEPESPVLAFCLSGAGEGLRTVTARLRDRFGSMVEVTTPVLLDQSRVAESAVRILPGSAHEIAGTYYTRNREVAIEIDAFGDWCAAIEHIEPNASCTDLLDDRPAAGPDEDPQARDCVPRGAQDRTTRTVGITLPAGPEYAERRQRLCVWVRDAAGNATTHPLDVVGIAGQPTLDVLGVAHEAGAARSWRDAVCDGPQFDAQSACAPSAEEAAIEWVGRRIFLELAPQPSDIAPAGPFASPFIAIRLLEVSGDAERYGPELLRPIRAPLSWTFDSDGPKTLVIEARDRANQPIAPVRLPFFVDTRPPVPSQFVPLFCDACAALPRGEPCPAGAVPFGPECPCPDPCASCISAGFRTEQGELLVGPRALVGDMLPTHLAIGAEPAPVCTRVALLDAPEAVQESPLCPSRIVPIEWQVSDDAGQSELVDRTIRAEAFDAACGVGTQQLDLRWDSQAPRLFLLNDQKPDVSVSCLLETQQCTLNAGTERPRVEFHPEHSNCLPVMPCEGCAFSPPVLTDTEIKLLDEGTDLLGESVRVRFILSPVRPPDGAVTLCEASRDSPTCEEGPDCQCSAPFQAFGSQGRRFRISRAQLELERLCAFDPVTGRCSDRSVGVDPCAPAIGLAEGQLWALVEDATGNRDLLDLGGCPADAVNCTPKQYAVPLIGAGGPHPFGAYPCGGSDARNPAVPNCQVLEE